MKILCDENIREAREAFGTLGEVRLFSGRQLTNRDVADSGAEILCVRSVTRVDRDLLEGTRVRFVTAATSGYDNIIAPDLAELGIPWAAACGSNANSVAEWVVSVLLLHAVRTKQELAGRRLGIVGVGHVGSLVARYAQALGLVTVLCDPPREQREREAGSPDPFRSASLEEALSCDIVTLHPCLTKEGPHPTYHLIGERELDLIPGDAVLIQASRGAVIASAPLKERLMRRRDLDFYADVWEGEPLPDKDIQCCAQISTMHIAGYSWDGKLRGTEMIYDAVCRFLKRKPAYVPDYGKAGSVHIDLKDQTGLKALYKAVSALYDPEEDDTALCPSLDMGDAKRGLFFENLRRDYRRRLEFSHGVVANAAPAEAAVLQKLGFAIDGQA